MRNGTRNSFHRRYDFLTSLLDGLKLGSPLRCASLYLQDPVSYCGTCDRSVNRRMTTAPVTTESHLAVTNVTAISSTHRPPQQFRRMVGDDRARGSSVSPYYGIPFRNFNQPKALVACNAFETGPYYRIVS
jgi:hypothetical protein